MSFGAYRYTVRRVELVVLSSVQHKANSNDGAQAG